MQFYYSINGPTGYLWKSEEEAFGRAFNTQKGGRIMAAQKKSVWGSIIAAMMMTCLVGALSGCATTKQLADVESKADQALQMAQEAKAMSDRADNAAARAEQAADRAEMAANKSEAIAAKVDERFMHKMKK